MNENNRENLANMYNLLLEIVNEKNNKQAIENWIENNFEVIEDGIGTLGEILAEEDGTVATETRVI